MWIPELPVRAFKEVWVLVFDNTDQKEVTRLGMDWEWATDVTVTREGNFTRSVVQEIDEAEIFVGAENSLTMNQTYTWEFQCKYELQRYPFDTQVNTHRVHFNSYLFSTEMERGQRANHATVP